MKKVIRKPVNWQDFEELCKKIWRYEYECNSIKKNGRQGNNQNGVDVSGFSVKLNGYFGIQCKGKDDYAKTTLTKKEMNAEIQKAKLFKPDLKEFIFTTTANKDAKIEEYIRLKDVESRSNGSFSITLYSWEDLVDFIEMHKPVYDWYVNSILHANQYQIDVKLSIETDSSSGYYVFRPTYTRQKIINELYMATPVERALFDYNKSLSPLIHIASPSLGEKTEKDGNHVDLKIEITNDGTGAFLNCNFGAEIITDKKIFFIDYSILGNPVSQYSEINKKTKKNTFNINVGMSKMFNEIIKFPDSIDTTKDLECEFTIHWYFSSEQNSEMYEDDIKCIVKPIIEDLPDVIKKVINVSDCGEKIIVKPKLLK